MKASNPIFHRVETISASGTGGGLQPLDIASATGSSFRHDII
jgi:hypothetical protein